MSEVMVRERYVALKKPAVACQVIDGEAIVIHFDRGFYFSATGSAAWLLTLLENGIATAAIPAALAERFGLVSERAENTTARFIDELVAEDLVVFSSPHEKAAPPASSVPAPGSGAPAIAFDEPHLVKYSDLQDLLVLDPIHDVMLSGWPARAE